MSELNSPINMTQEEQIMILGKQLKDLFNMYWDLKKNFQNHAHFNNDVYINVKKIKGE